MSITDIHTLDHTVLLCAHMTETRAFYQDVMRFPIEVDRDTWVSFRVGSSLLTLRPRGTNPVWDDGPSVAGSASVQLAFRVPPLAIDACHDWLVSKGVPIIRVPNWRHRTVFFRDPEANVIEIYAEY
jgi:catechol 2,3-dioxygenase-like lactoylglutathione lyase family enzyme